MASLQYQCTICKQFSVSAMVLHHHHVRYHTLEELSHAIISLRGLNVLQKPNKVDYVKHKNNKAMDLKVYSKKKMKTGHDTAKRLVNCESITSERELNGALEINDQDFVYCLESLCKDLECRGYTGKKRINSTAITDAKAKSLIKSSWNHDPTETENTVAEKSSNPVSQTFVATTSGSNDKLELVTEKVTEEDGNYNLRIQEITDENNNEETSSSMEIDFDKDILIYDETNESFLWGTVITVESNVREVESHVTSDQKSQGFQLSEVHCPQDTVREEELNQEEY